MSRFTFLLPLLITISAFLCSIVCFKDDGKSSANNALSSPVSSIKQWVTLRRQLRHRSARSSTLFRRRTGRSKEVCFDKIGCFQDNNPFDHFTALPASPEKIGTSFTLFTKNNPKSGENLDYLNVTLRQNSHFQKGKQVKIIIHGFGGNGKKPWVLQMAEAFLEMGDYNVIVVDWKRGASPPNYVQAAANARLVGKQIALLIHGINRETGLTAKDYHIIGFSLGAQIAGFAGSEVRNISRITGLDPASPLFERYSEIVRLDPSDADFVDVIHTNGESIHRGGLGSMTPMGHIDFYPNGGREQPGCNSIVVGAIKYVLNGKREHNLCHHRRAARLFIESMRFECKMQAFACESYEKFLRGQCFSCGTDGKGCATMGYFANRSNTSGSMYLLTREKEPFCGNTFKLEIKNQAEQGSTWGKFEIDLSSETSSEPFQLTSEKDEVKDSYLIQGLIVAQSNFKNVTHVVMNYRKYRGWIYSGKNSWNIQKIALTNIHGESVSSCGLITLNDGTPLKIDLLPGNCTTQTSISTF